MNARCWESGKDQVPAHVPGVGGGQWDKKNFKINSGRLNVLQELQEVQESGRRLSGDESEPAVGGKGGFSVALRPPGRHLELIRPGGPAPLSAAISFQPIHHPCLGRRRWAVKQSDTVVSQAPAATSRLAPTTGGHRGNESFGSPGNVSVGPLPPDEEVGRLDDCSGRERPAFPAARSSLQPLVFPVLCLDTVRLPCPHEYRDLRTTTPRRPKARPLGDLWRTARRWALSELSSNPSYFRPALPEVPERGHRGWPGLPGRSRAFQRPRWRPSIPNLPKESCSCRLRHLLGTMAPGLPRSFKPNW